MGAAEDMDIAAGMGAAEDMDIAAETAATEDSAVTAIPAAGAVAEAGVEAIAAAPPVTAE